MRKGEKQCVCFFTNCNLLIKFHTGSVCGVWSSIFIILGICTDFEAPCTVERKKKKEKKICNIEMQAFYFTSVVVFFFTSTTISNFNEAHKNQCFSWLNLISELSSKGNNVEFQSAFDSITVITCQGSISPKEKREREQMESLVERG